MAGYLEQKVEGLRAVARVPSKKCVVSELQTLMFDACE